MKVSAGNNMHDLSAALESHVVRGLRDGSYKMDYDAFAKSFVSGLLISSFNSTRGKFSLFCTLPVFGNNVIV